MVEENLMCDDESRAENRKSLITFWFRGVRGPVVRTTCVTWTQKKPLADK